jgi:hypothetical protein
MTSNLLQWTRFILLIIRKGALPKQQYDYDPPRIKILEEVPQFFPFAMEITRKKKGGYWSGQIAFMKNASKITGGHLSVPEKKLCYIRNPKAGSTSLSFAMLAALYPEIKDYDLSAEKINTITDVHIKREISIAERSFTYFTAVRNPFARVVSVYRSFFEKSSGRFIYDDYLFGILKKNNSFGEFVNTLESIPDFLKDQHLRSQHAFLKYYQRKNINVKVLHLESPDSIDLFVSPYQTSLLIMNKDELPYDYRPYYDNRILAKVYRIYEQDIKQFGYEKEYDHLKSFINETTRET